MSLHSSITQSNSLKDYISRENKHYYLPLFKQCLFPATVADIVGSNNDKDRSLSEIKSSIIKAKQGFYSHIKVPYDRHGDSFIERVFELSKEAGLGIVLQICSSQLKDKTFWLELKASLSDLSVEWILDDCSGVIGQRLAEVDRQALNSFVSIAVHKKILWHQILIPRVLDLFKSFHLYFPYQLDPKSDYLNCKESHKLVGLLRKRFPNHKFLPPKAVDIWDHRALHDFDMEPYVLPCFESQTLNPQIKYSVIIPTFNNQNHLRVVLRHLYKQNLSKDNFEVIVVDDGGMDLTQPLVMEMMAGFEEKMNFKYIYFPRSRKRTMGDSQYRAGISRNLGAKNAVGEIFCFLDSDIVVPRDYLQKVGESLQTWDAIQAKRVNLSETTSHLSFDYDQCDPKTDLIDDEPYWTEFIKTENWHELPYNWKYVCTHSFSLRRDLFWQVGGLKKNYIYYGFEDTDLGYRLVKSGYRLHLLDVRVYHLFHENSRSEFMNLKSLRHSLLSRTAQIFYLHHLDEDIFENLLGFMEPEPSFKRLFKRIAKTMSLHFLWGPRHDVYTSLNQFNPSTRKKVGSVHA